MVKEIRETIRLIYKIFPLRQSRDRLDGTPLRRPCLNYQMGRCLAPCAGYPSMKEYQQVVQDVKLFLKGKNNELIKSLEKKMNSAANQLNYEEAGVYRDKISAVQTVLSKQKIISTSLEDQDILGYCRENNQVMIQILIVRNGKMVGEKNYRMKILDDAGNNEILSSFLKQYYADEIILPKTILLPQSIDECSLIEDWLSKKKRRPCSAGNPFTREKKRSFEHGERKCKFCIKNGIR